MLTVVLICHVVSQVATVNCHDCGTSTVQLDQSDCQVRLRRSTLATVDSNREEELSDVMPTSHARGGVRQASNPLA